MEDGTELIKIDTNTIMSSYFVNSVRTASVTGEDQYKNCVQERLKTKTESAYDGLHRNNTLYYNTPYFKMGTKKSINKER